MKENIRKPRKFFLKSLSNNKRRKMECNHFKSSLIDFCEETLSPSKTFEMNVHICKCDSCNKFYSKMYDLFEQMKAEKKIEPNPYFVSRVLANLNPEKENNQKLPGLFLIMPNRVSIALILFVGIMTGAALTFFLQPVENTIVNEDEVKNELISTNDNNILTLNDE